MARTRAQSLFAFRTRGHASWFVASLLLVSVAGAAAFSGSAWPAVFFSVFHFGVAWDAAHETHWGRRESAGAYSRDCIWFNALMGSLNAAIAIFA